MKEKLRILPWNTFSSPAGTEPTSGEKKKISRQAAALGNGFFIFSGQETGRISCRGLGCARCLLLLPSFHTHREPACFGLGSLSCYLWAIHLTEGRSLCSRQAALGRGQVGLLVPELKAAAVLHWAAVTKKKKETKPSVVHR